MSTQYTIENMKCDGCVTSVKDALQQLPSCTGVSIDLAAGSAEISGDVDPQTVEKTLTDLGYPTRKQV